MQFEVLTRKISMKKLMRAHKITVEGITSRKNKEILLFAQEGNKWYYKRMLRDMGGDIIEMANWREFSNLEKALEIINNNINTEMAKYLQSVVKYYQ